MGIGPHFPKDDCLVEVSWSKPIDRHNHSLRKQLTKAFTSGNGLEGSLPPSIPVATPPFAPLLMPNAAANILTPRPRGAAGIRGLGAPGTPPPRSLIRKLNTLSNPVGSSGTAPSSLFNYQKLYEDFYEMVKSNQGMLNEFAGEFQGIIPPPGAPTSPTQPQSNGGHAFLGGTTTARLFPAPPLSMQSPFYFYGNGHPV